MYYDDDDDDYFYYYCFEMYFEMYLLTLEFQFETVRQYILITVFDLSTNVTTCLLHSLFSIFFL